MTEPQCSKLTDAVDVDPSITLNTNTSATLTESQTLNNDNTLNQNDEVKHTYIGYTEIDGRVYYVNGMVKALKMDEVLVYETDVQFSIVPGAESLVKKYGFSSQIGRGWHGRTIGIPTKNSEAGYFEVTTELVYSREGVRSITLQEIANNFLELKRVAEQNPLKKFILLLDIGWDVHGNPNPTFSGYKPPSLVKLIHSLEMPSNVIFPLYWYVDESLWKGENKEEDLVVDIVAKYVVKEPELYEDDTVVRDSNNLTGSKRLVKVKTGSKQKSAEGTGQLNLF